jgi:hypothetical protein
MAKNRKSGLPRSFTLKVSRTRKGWAITSRAGRVEADGAYGPLKAFVEAVKLLAGQVRP